VLDYLTTHSWTIFFGVLAIGALILLALIISAAIKKNEAPMPEKVEADRGKGIRLRFLRKSFRRAVEFVETKLASRSQKYNYHWSIVFDEGTSRDAVPFDQSGIPQSFDFSAKGDSSDKGLQWDVFDRGLTVQFKSDFLGKHTEKDIVDNKTWSDFLTLAENYRSERPFDSVVIAIPFSELLTNDPSADASLAQRARALQKRILQAQVRFALTFPVYILVTECESVPGFAKFAAALSPPMRNSIMGWSNALELTAPFLQDWVDSGLDSVLADVQEASIELAALAPGGQESSGHFMLPLHLEKVRHGLRLFIREVFKPSSYHSAFPLRGFYFTGDVSPESQVLAIRSSNLGEAEGAETQPKDVSEQTFDLKALDEVARSAVEAINRDPVIYREPVFLRDFIELKVFSETGLVRKASSYRMRVSGSNRLLRWAGVALIGFWCVALVGSSMRLAWVKDERLTLERKHQARDIKNLTRDPNESLPDLIERLKTQLSQELEIASNAVRPRELVWAIMMPGSWPIFNDLNEQLNVHFSHIIARSLQEDLRRLTYARISDLTGSRLDNITGTLSLEKTCALPKGLVKSDGLTLEAAVDPEDQPSYFPLMQYVDMVHAISDASSVINRFSLNDPRVPALVELRETLTLLLGAAPAFDVNGAYAFLSRGREDTAAVEMQNVRPAFECALGMGLAEFRKSLFENSKLTQLESRIAGQLTAFSSERDTAEDPGAWRMLSANLKEEEQIFSSGRGSWVRLEKISDDPSVRMMLNKIATSPLLGKDVARLANKQLQADFDAFKSKWTEAVEGGVSKGDLIWDQKTGAWETSKDRKALSLSVEKLLSGPWKEVHSKPVLPDADSDDYLSWDVSKLDEALAISDEMRKIKQELMPGVPFKYRANFDRFINQQITFRTAGLVSDAVVWSSMPAGNKADRESANARIAKIAMLFKWLNAKDLSRQMQNLVSTEATNRLYLINEEFVAAELFAPLNSKFKNWRNEMPPMMAAYGFDDMEALQTYVDQQIIAAGKFAQRASAVLSQLSDEEQVNPLVTRWAGIVQEVERYKLKSPRSALVSLEKLLLADPVKFKLDECASQAFGRNGSRGTNYFQAKFNSLRSNLASRCQVLVAEGYRAEWDNFAQHFNTNLKGRFPFVYAGATDGVSPATLDDIKTSFDLYASAKKSLGSKLQKDPSISAFAESMDEMVNFMTPIFLSDGKLAPGYDISFDFRVAREQEKFANTIIAWELRVGKDVLKSEQPRRKLYWKPGFPISLKMRHAKDGPIKPASPTGDEFIQPSGQSVVLSARTAWSLFELLSRYGDPVSQGLVDEGVNVLSLKYPWTSSVVKLTELPRNGFATVGVGFQIRPRGKNDLLIWPRVLPISAPDWKN